MYITAEYYKNDYMGTPVADSDLPGLIRRASDAIDSLTHYKINDSLLSAYPFIHTQVKKATCAQVEFFAVNGELAGNVVEGGGAGFTIGKYSESGQATAAPTVTAKYAIGAIDYLTPTGLLYSGVRTVQRRCY